MYNKDFAGCGMGVEMEAGCVIREILLRIIALIRL